VVRVIQIDGLLDRVQADFWEHSIHDADTEQAAALIVQINSSRSVLSTAQSTRLRGRLARAKTPVAAWVGPSRSARVAGGALKLLHSVDVVGVAPGAKLGSGRAVKSFEELKDVSRNTLQSATLGDFIVDLTDAGISIPTKVVHPKGSKVPHREPLVDVRFSKPSLTARAIHGVTSPGPAYALLLFGLLLALLEFATAGVGLAAITAAIFLALGALGLGGLPVNGIAVAAIVFATFGFGIDAQAGAPRAWTAIGTGFLLFGTLFLYRDGMHVPIVWIVGVLGLAAAFVLAGLPSLIRARFSSPTIGREGFIGELGIAVGELGPEGVVTVRGGTWRARTNRATPIPDGGAIRVVGIDGLVLDVEPEEGGAKDYREH
jgi:membrane-bound serine protease (ClpP class)